MKENSLLLQADWIILLPVTQNTVQNSKLKLMIEILGLATASLLQCYVVTLSK